MVALIGMKYNLVTGEEERIYGDVDEESVKKLCIELQRLEYNSKYLEA